MKSLVLGVSGSVAAYRAADLARTLMKSGWQVRVCLTDSAKKFVTPALFEALTGQPCLEDVFEEPVKGKMAHIEWARQADVVAVVPATANTVAKIAHGIGEDMLTTLVLASTKPILVAPAMNPAMYADAAFQDALEILRGRGARIVEPLEGDVACGENGQGKLASIEALSAEIDSMGVRSNRLKGQKVLITCGPTQEPLDSVRYLTNRSSGKMGMELARAAVQMGAEVTVVHGPVHVPVPFGAKAVRVRTALEMLSAAEQIAPTTDWVFGVAAVADYRPAHRHEGKLRRSAENMALELVPNPDIIAQLAKVAKPSAKVVAFAAEPGNQEDSAKEKLARKGVFALASNDILGATTGFEVETNSLTLFSHSGATATSGNLSKFNCAVWLLETVSDWAK